MTPTDPSPPGKEQKKKSPITDVVQFFADTTEAYNRFQKSIIELTSTIPDLTPRQLRDKCDKLRRERANLEILDQQMFEILYLAGDSIIGDQMVQDFRIVLEKANTASQALHRELQALKETLQKNGAEIAGQKKNSS